MSQIQRFAVVTLIAGCAFAGSPADALVYTYDNTTSGTLSNAATPCANPLVRTFTVSQSFTVSTIAVGLNISHLTRGHIRATLVAPGGSSFQFVTDGGDTDDNYDVMLSTNTEGTLDDNDADPVAEPHYSRIATVGGMNFYTGNANGTWSLRICDNVAATNGTFNRARLVLTSTATATATCTGLFAYDWGSNGESAAFTNATTGDITITQGTSTDFGGTGSTNNFATRTSTQGGHAGFYSLTMDAFSTAGTQTDEEVGLATSFSFSRPVRDLSIGVLDVDTTNNSWEDQIAIIGRDGSGNPVPYDRVFVNTAQPAGNWAEADSTVDPANDDGNVNYTFDGAIESIEFSYSQGSTPTSENRFMVIGVSDLSFCAYDYGDAPDTYGTLLSGGARHLLGDRTLYLGTNPPDGEADGQAAAASTTDDTTTVGGVDDEDGVSTFPNYAAGSTTYTVSVTANNQSTTQAASLVGYLDWNRDGDFLDADEVSATVNVPANTVNGAFNVTWSSVPANAGGTTATYARFRISYTTSEVTSPTGLATSGEVEDYQIPAGVLPVTLASFETRQAADGLLVRWSTETETGTVGYRLLALGKAGAVPLTEKLVPSHATDSLVPRTYELEVPASALAAAGASHLVLVDFGTRGERTRHGPFAIGETYGAISDHLRIDWATIRGEAELEAVTAASLAATEVAGGFPVALLKVTEEGLYRVRYEDLLAAGLDFAGAPANRLGLSVARSGQLVPLHVATVAGAPSPGPGTSPGSPPGAGGNTFGPGAWVEFRGVPAADNQYHRERVYRLAVLAQPALRPSDVAAAPSGPPLASYQESSRTDRDREYSFAAPNGDPWYEDRVLANGGPGARDFTFTADALAGSGGKLTVELWGVTDWPGNAPDHHLQLEVNGTRLVDERFDGLIARTYELNLPAGLLRDGDNTLTVRLPGDTGYLFDLVHVDAYTVTWPRRFVAQADRLTVRGTAGRTNVDGFTSPDVVAWARSGQWRLSGLVTTPQGGGFRASLNLPVSTGSNNVVDLAAVSALRLPEIAPARVVPGDLLTGSGQYLIVTHPNFASGLGSLVAAKQAQGLSVKTVDVFDLYAAYTGFEPDPEAIRTYVEDAALRLGTRFVLLVGGDTYDYLDHLGLGSFSFVPTLYSQTDDLVRYSPADPLFGDTDRDGVPDLPVGRLPVRTSADLALLLAKMEAAAGTPASALFAADASTAREFTGISHQLAAKVPAGWPKTEALIDDLGIDGARQVLLGAFGAGAALVNFVGHSGPTVWSFSGLFSTTDAEQLGNAGAPALVVQWGCWNTYHVAPVFDTLAHRLLLAGPQGASAVVGSATLSSSSSDALLGPKVIERLFLPGKTIGEAMVEAKRKVAQEGGDRRDVLVGWTLLGDPAQVLVPAP